MNGSVDPSLSQRSSSPRPPVEGKEVAYHEEKGDRWNSRQRQVIFGNGKEFRIKMGSSFCNTPENAPALPVSLESEKNAYEDHDCLESVSSSPPAEPGTPPYFKWAQNLHFLLNDIEGVGLFMQYLKQENHGTVALDFWFACEGVKKDYSPESKEHIRKIRAIYRYSIKRLEEISRETKNEIKNKIESQIGADQTIFDAAQREVEDVIMRTTYPNFLRSDLYLQHIQGIQNCTLQDSPKGEGTPVTIDNGDSVPREGLAVLPTVHEDSELQISTCGRIPLTREALLQRNRFCSSDLPVRTRPEAEAGHYLKPPNKSYTSCHVKYSSYLPTSEQNSELHSMSSDAQTDDAVSVADASVEHGPCLNNKSYPKKQKTSKYDWPVNKDSLSHNTFIPRTQQRMPPINELYKHPKQFAAVLSEKLNDYLRDLESGKKMNEHMQKLEDWKTSSKDYDELPSSSLKYSMQIWNLSSKLERLSYTEDSQAILDQHVSRVWQDSAHQTPARSPGCISPPAQADAPVLDCRKGNPCTSGSSHAVSNIQGVGTTFGTQHSYHKTNRSPQCMPFYNVSSSRHRKDRDVCSSDSGTVHDFTPDEPIVPPPLHNHKNVHYSQSNYTSGVDPYPPASADHFQNRRCRDSQRRSNSKKLSMTDSSSSCVDSGVSVVCDPVPSHLARERVTNWLDCKSEKDLFTHHKKSSHSATSPVLSRSSKKPVMYNSSRPGTLEGGNSPWPQLPSNTTSSTPQSSRYERSHHSVQLCQQPAYPLDPAMPPLPQPDTTTQLVEARRRLEDERAKQMKLKPNTSRDKALCDVSKMRSLYKMTNDLPEDSTLHRKSSRKSCPGSVQSCGPAPTSDMTVIGYCFGSKTVPYLTKLPGKNITLRQFKTLISKKGNFKYFFKKASDDFGTGVVFEEISDDYEVLPLWEGKIFSVIEQFE